MNWSIIFSDMNEGLELIVNLITILGIGGITFVVKKEMGQIYEHRAESLFGYYSRMKIILMSIQRNLGLKNNTPLLKGLDNKMLNKYHDSYKVDETLFDSLKSDAEELLYFFKNENWQIPLDTDFAKKIQDLINNTYKILDVYSYTKYSSIEEVSSEHEQIINNIKELIEKIECEQGKLTPKKEKPKKGLLFRIWNRKRFSPQCTNENESIDKNE